MVSTFTIVSIAGGLVTLAVLATVIVMLENNSKRKAKLKDKILQRIKTYQNLLTSFDPKLMPIPVRSLLLDEILLGLNSIEKLDSQDNWVQRQIVVTNDEINQLKHAKAPSKNPTVKAQALRETQQRLQHLVKVLQFIGRSRRSRRTLVAEQIKELSSLYVRIGVNTHQQIAEQALSQSKHKVALHHLNQALAQYSRSNHRKFVKEIEQLRQKVQTVTQQLSSSQQQAMQAQAQAKVDPNKKDRGLDRMFDEQAASTARRSLR